MQLPIEDLCSLSSRSLQSPFTATVPDSTEDILLKGFQMLNMENNRIETAQQVSDPVSFKQLYTQSDLLYPNKMHRCNIIPLFFVVFCLVCQAAGKHGPGRECKIQVCKS